LREQDRKVDARALAPSGRLHLPGLGAAIDVAP